jgi:hypothetical protein
MLLAHVVAPLVIMLTTTILLLLNDTVAIVFVALYCVCWMALTLGLGLLLPRPSIPAWLRGLDLLTLPRWERCSYASIGLLAPLAFLIGMEALSFDAIVRWVVSLGIASLVAGLVTQAAITSRTELDREEALRLNLLHTLDKMAGMPPSTSAEIAAATGLNERYVREWLGTALAGIVEFDVATKKYELVGPKHDA